MVPYQAFAAISEMLDHCAQVQAGQNVLIVAYLDGLHGGPNLVDAEAVAWLQAAVRQRGADPAVLWVDEPARAHVWRLPPVLKAAMRGANVMINCSFELTWEEILELREAVRESGVTYVANFATTAPLLASDWAQTPHELVSLIRRRTGSLIQERIGQTFRLTHPNGTRLEGKVGPAWVGAYTDPRTIYRPFPEWVHPPVAVTGVEGTLVFDRMLSWWSRYIGIPPFFDRPLEATVAGGRITRFKGGKEAEAMRRFFASMAERLGETVYEVQALHSGIHPNASVDFHQCPHVLRRRWVDHSHSSNIHVHLGHVENLPKWPYWWHVTADIRGATWQVGDALVHDQGRLTALDHPEVRAMAARYPDRPGLG